MEALPLLEELRNPLIEAGEQDKFLKAVSATVAKCREEPAPLELLIDYCRHTSNPFNCRWLSASSPTFTNRTGNFTRAEECLQKLIDRNKNDERLVRTVEPVAVTERRDFSAVPV